jgi:membrane-bound serine protease (ClpP class)
MNPFAHARIRLAVRSCLAAIGFAGLLALAGSGASADPGGTVVLLPTSGIVDQVMATYIADGIQRAADQGAVAVIIQLDTPGGSLDSMRDIFQAELNAPLPVIVWVGPSGARAASAGTFITLAAHVVAMAPGTNIGAASPVDQNGQDITGTEGQKVLNDAVATMTAIAQHRGRPVDWAVSTVTDAKSYTVEDAIAAGAADFEAASLEDVLAGADGRVVDVAGMPTTVHTAGATLQQLDMNGLQSFLHLLADPNIAFILFTVGFYGLLFELAHPNLITGILGALAIILAFIGFGSLPLNVAGLLLIGLAVVLFVFDLMVTNHGAPTVGGLVAFVLGAGTLYTAPSTPTGPDVSVAWPLIAVMTGFTAVVVLGIIRVAWRVRLLPKVNIGVPGSGSPLASGTQGVVRRPVAPMGTVYAGGEEWTARSSTGAPLDRGTPVEVVGHEGLVLLVAPAVPWAPLTTGLGQAH